MYSGLPFRHGFYYTQGFFIATISDASQHLKIGKATIWLDNEPYKHSSIGTSLFSLCGILDLFRNILHHGIFSIWKFRHLLDNHIRFTFIYRYRVYNYPF